MALCKFLKSLKRPIYTRFLDTIPEYLARHYWWAYLWRPGVWFFDHEAVINAILFGQYPKLMHATLKAINAYRWDRILQIACVYGQLTPHLLALCKGGLHLTDVAPIQLGLVRRKWLTLKDPSPLYLTRMNAECLGYKNDTFDTVVLFFLLHEMPTEARQHTLNETVRVLKSGGRIIISDYAPLPKHHLFYRFPLSRFLLSRLEPFLPEFWQEDLNAKLVRFASYWGKRLIDINFTPFFYDFYRVSEYILQ